ncbi:MAG TPA: alpha-L-arabinofuranosidase C-terminal domain-containing protein [Vicinamibacterales bacterium]|nr:alpha-L-arabinofuranosidase C-terminal domain-containing protein [Vicinamibacterales bacterium]
MTQPGGPTFRSGMLTRISFALVPLLLTSFRAAGPTVTIDAAAPAGKVSPLLYGLMTEEINHAYDGGLYAELVQNRAFLDDKAQPTHWSIIQKEGAAAKMSLDPATPLSDAIPTSLRVDVTRASPGHEAGIANEGYWGIPVRRNARYRASFFAKAATAFTGPVVVSLDSADGTVRYASVNFQGVTSAWKRYEVTLTPKTVVTPTAKARLTLTTTAPVTIWFGLVSLFPPTFRDQPNGFRPVLLQMLVDMRPKFLRFPGGNYLEGDQIAGRFDWKKTLGPLEDRPGHQGPWSYRSTDGLGLYEFLLWCEDMNAEPVLAVYAGYSLKGAHVDPGRDLEPYIQDALDEIEYVSGPATSKWGALRAQAGHPAPFTLTYVEIGNEDWFDKSGSYDRRFAQFTAAIKSRYPRLQTISAVGLEHPETQRVKSITPDVLDEHYYLSVEEFLKKARGQYETYDRKGPKIFVGEWGTYETPFVPWDARSRTEAPTPNMRAAIGDAAWMAEMERNADLVVMHCYAPLLVNVSPGARQWRPNLIGYDALHVYGSPSYHAIKLFSTHLGDQILNATATDTDVLVSVTRDSRSGTIYAKFVNPHDRDAPVQLDVKGVQSLAPTARAVTIAADMQATNSIDSPANVGPVPSSVSGVKPGFTYTIPAHGIVVLELATQ